MYFKLSFAVVFIQSDKASREIVADENLFFYLS